MTVLLTHVFGILWFAKVSTQHKHFTIHNRSDYPSPDPNYHFEFSTHCIPTVYSLNHGLHLVYKPSTANSNPHTLSHKPFYCFDFPAWNCLFAISTTATYVKCFCMSLASQPLRTTWSAHLLYKYIMVSSFSTILKFSNPLNLGTPHNQVLSNLFPTP